MLSILFIDKVILMVSTFISVMGCTVAEYWPRAWCDSTNSGSVFSIWTRNGRVSTCCSFVFLNHREMGEWVLVILVYIESS